MQNAVLIALVLLIVVFVVNQYNPSFFSFMQRCEGFVTSKGATATTGATSGTTTGTPASPASAATAATSATAATAKNSSMTPMTPEEKAKADADKAALAMTPAGKKEGFADLGSYEGPASFGSAEAPAGCYPRDQLTPAELLPKDMNSIWAEQNPMGPGSLKGKNFLSAGALIGVNTVGQSLRNANLQIRSEPPNPQVPVSIFLQSTIGPDISHRSLEIN